MRLSPDDRSLNKYQVLQKADVKSSTAILDPNSPGSSSLRLSWIWQKHSGSMQSDPESILECKSKPNCLEHKNSIIIVSLQFKEFIGYVPGRRIIDGRRS